MVKSIKILMAVSAMALIAVSALGASSASATLLCKENVTTCAEKDIYPSGTSVSATLTSTFESGFGPKCTGSTLSGKTTAEKGSPQPAEITNLTFSGCTSCPFGLSTKVEAQNLPYAANLAKTTEDDGTLTIGNSGKGTPELKVLCASVTCLFSLEKLPVSFNGGNPATLALGSGKMKVVEDTSGIGMCTKEPTPKATYEVTSPNPAHVSLAAGADETVFCKEAGPGCAPSSIYANETSFEAKDTYVKLDNLTACEATLNFKNVAQGGSPLPIYATALNFTNCIVNEGPCKSTTGYEPPFGWSATATTGGNGQVKANLQLLRICYGKECVYEANPTGTFNGGSTPSIAFEGIALWLKSGSAPFCAESWTISETIKYNITTPTPVYLTKREA
jgi:hypothetical protein